MVRAVVFDIGGVLEITPPTGWKQRWCDQLGVSGDELGGRLGNAVRRGAVGDITLEEFTATVSTAFDLDADATARFMGDVWDEYLGTANTELIAYFEGLRDRGLRTGILSNSFVGARELEQERYGFADRCEVVVYSHEEGLEKPDPAFYAVVCDRLDVAPEEVVFLDDLPMCVEGAEAVGMTAVLYRDNAQAIADIEVHLTAAG